MTTTGPSVAATLSVTVCGSYRRAPAQLSADYQALGDAGCRILSPVDPTFVEEQDGFVYASHELGEAPAAIEERHLQAMEAADFIWLHAPDGYVGRSGSMELGFAHALGTPIFARERPSDVVFGGMVTVVSSPREAINRIRQADPDAPVRSLSALQSYYGRVAAERGYADETLQDCMLLLTEEVGELARAVRKRLALTRDHGYADEDAAVELADIQLYLLHLANILDVDLAQAVAGKERVNATRSRANAQAA